ncbi:MAG TPA: VOC family protein [Blastocatellia bacterium]|nr:VOC family protein [Blastocatellia bacterium]
MSCELDHLFVCTAAGAPEAGRLIEFGLTEGTPNTHPGQGTANRRFFFHNAFLELLWVHNPQEAQSEAIRPLHLWERWSGRGKETCPFGFIFRPAGQEPGGPPFPTWEYRPSYLPEPLSIEVGTNADTLTEPMLFYMAFGRRTDVRLRGQPQPREHSAGGREITRLHFGSPHADELSAELRATVDSGLVSFGAGETYLLEIGFDGESQGRSADFRPALPLVFRW